MTIPVECPECEHEWGERSSKAGRSVKCPECQTSVKVSRAKSAGGSRPVHRPQKSDSNVAKVVLIGGSIFLVGVLAMIGIRMSQIVEDPEGDGQKTPVTVPTDGNNGDVVGGAASETDSVPGVTIPSDDGTVPVTVGTTTDTPPPATGNGEPDGMQGSFDGPNVQTATNTDRGRELMAAMNDVGLRVSGFSADARGAVRTAVKTEVAAAIERCKLTTRAPFAPPVMEIVLSMRDGKLAVAAKLIAKDGDNLVSVWERSGTVTELKDQALNSGLLPGNLDRDVGAFFTSLRQEFVQARRQFSQ